MHRFNFVLVKSHKSSQVIFGIKISWILQILAICALSQPCHTSDINNAILYSNGENTLTRTFLAICSEWFYTTGIPNVAVVDQPQLIQTANSDNVVITPPDYLNLNNQVSFAAPVGAQHPNQKPQPEPRPPPYEPTFRHYHDHSVHIDSGYARSHVQYQRTFY